MSWHQLSSGRRCDKRQACSWNREASLQDGMAVHKCLVTGKRNVAHMNSACCGSLPELFSILVLAH